MDGMKLRIGKVVIDVDSAYMQCTLAASVLYRNA